MPTVALLVLLVSLVCPAKTMAIDTNLTIAPKVAITNLLAHKEDYKSKRVEVTGYYYGSFERYVLFESEAKLDLNNCLWIDVFSESPGYKQRMSQGSRANFRGSVRIVGTFDYRPGYGCGHMGACPAMITKMESFEEIK